MRCVLYNPSFLHIYLRSVLVSWVALFSTRGTGPLIMFGVALLHTLKHKAKVIKYFFWSLLTH